MKKLLVFGLLLLSQYSYSYTGGKLPYTNKFSFEGGATLAIDPSSKEEFIRLNGYGAQNLIKALSASKKMVTTTKSVFSTTTYRTEGDNIYCQYSESTMSKSDVVCTIKIDTKSGRVMPSDSRSLIQSSTVQGIESVPGSSGVILVVNRDASLINVLGPSTIDIEGNLAVILASKMTSVKSVVDTDSEGVQVETKVGEGLICIVRTKTFDVNNRAQLQTNYTDAQCTLAFEDLSKGRIKTN